MFAPRFTITPAITQALMALEADRQAIVELPIDVAMLASLRETARLAATHYSTQIEGNRLTQAQVQEVVEIGAHFPGRQRDEWEVRHYYRALEEVERLATQTDEPISEESLQRLHALVMTGSAAPPTPYRDGQNVIRDSVSGGIVYMPPAAKDVPALMSDLLEWINRELPVADLPAPLVAALAHYQFATIHPYFDGNGRTARLLTTLLLHRSGYGLKGIYNLEEYYAQHLSEYYRTLAVGPSHNDYFGRAEAEATEFVGYFCTGMAAAFAAVRAQAVHAARRGASDHSLLLRRLDPRQRRILSLFHGQETATAGELGAHLGLNVRSAATLCRTWAASGFLVVRDPSRRNRSYSLGAEYEPLALHEPL